jgi:hypothetical protein
MTGIVPENQTVSFSTYVSAISCACIEIPWEFVAKHADRICRAFEIGEPIPMMVEEIKMRFEERPRGTFTKTPLQLAKEWKAQGRT